MGGRQLAPGEYFSFNLVLIGRAVADLPILIHAWQMALKAGLGVHHARAELIEVVFEPGQAIEQSIYRGETPNQLLPTPVFTPEPLPETDTLNLRLETPLRIKHQGKVLSSALRGRDFLIALLRRYYLLQEFHASDYQAPDFQALAMQAEKIQASHQLHWCEWDRYSNRQQQKMTFGGVLGTITLNGDLAPFLSLLLQGQWLHVGNKTTFGMGRYVIMPQPSFG